MSSSRLGRVVLAATAALLLVLTGPALAHPTAATMDGTGTYSPGVPVSGCYPQTVTFDGTLVAAGNHTAIYAVHLEGTTDGCSTLTSERGSGTMSGAVYGNVNWVRTGDHVVYSGTLVIAGVVHTMTGSCVRTWTSLNPAASYADHCHLVLS